MRRPKRNIFYKLYLFLEIMRMKKFLFTQIFRRNITEREAYELSMLHKECKVIVNELKQAI